MSNIFNQVKELLIFYVKTHYNNYLQAKNIDKIPEDEIELVVNKIYKERKNHTRTFIINGLKTLLNDEYPGDAVINNIVNEIFDDDDLCINKLILEIKLHQTKHNDTI